MPEYPTADGTKIRIDDRVGDLFTSRFTNQYIGSSSSSSGTNIGGTYRSVATNEIEEVDDIFEDSSSTLRYENYDDDPQRFINDVRDRIPATIKESELEGMTVSSSCGSSGLYVAVGNSGSSVEALWWTLKNLAVHSWSFVYLVHVYPQVRLIPSPLGMLPKERVRPQQVHSYMKQESIKRREFLQKFIDMCTTSKVKVETLLIESDDTAKAIIDLILVLNIRKLVLGISKSNIKRLRKGMGLGGQMLKHASDTCEIKIICEGKEVTFEEIGSCLSSPQRNSINSTEFSTELDRQYDDSSSTTSVNELDNDERKIVLPCCFGMKIIHLR